MLTFEQKRARLSGIGSSDAPIIALGGHYGLTPLDLWKEKVGMVVRPEMTGPDIARGNRQEKVAAEVYVEKFGGALHQKAAMIRSDNHPFMIADLDRIDQDGCPVEIKCPRESEFKIMLERGIPLGYLVQVHHQLIVSGAETAHLAVYCPQTDDLERFRIDADRDVHGQIIEAEALFWGHVETVTPPQPMSAIAIPNPAPGRLVEMDSEDWRKAAAEYIELHSIKKEAEEAEDAVKERLMALAGRHDLVAGAGVRGRKITGRTTFDNKAFFATYPRLLKKARPFFKNGDPSYRFITLEEDDNE